MGIGQGARGQGMHAQHNQETECRVYSQSAPFLDEQAARESAEHASCAPGSFCQFFEDVLNVAMSESLACKAPKRA